MMTLGRYCLVATGGLVVGICYLALAIGHRPAGIPPGPPTIPIFGNLLQMPKHDAHIQFQKWAKKYGPIYSLILGTRILIVLSSDIAIKDLLDKRSGIYSDRQDLYISSGIVSGGLRVLLMRYGATWRMIHKIIHNILNITAAKSYVPYQDLESKQMLAEILSKPNNFMDEIRRYTFSLTTQMIFGFRTKSVTDPKFMQLFHGLELFFESAATGTSAFLDFFPLLRHIPDMFLPLRVYAKDLHVKEKAFYTGLWVDAKEKIQAGTAKPSFCVNLVKAQEQEGFSDDLAGYISGSLLEAGSDTTAATIIAFVQAMVLYPEVQKRAQEEIERVVGPNRLPTMEDEPYLPFTRGIVKESLRWMPTNILGVPHAVTKDDEYMGFKIPKGAGVVNNVWTIHHDEDRYPHPYRFDPERYIHDTQTAGEAAKNADPSKRDHYVFGAGRRICQGMHVAERSLFLAMSRMLWAFNFNIARHEHGATLIPDPSKLTQGLFVMPVDFPADIQPRSAERATMVEKEWADCETLLDTDMQWKKVPEGMIFSDYNPMKNLE